MKFDIWEVVGYDRDAAVALCRDGLNPLIAVLLAARGITDPARAHAFLKCDETCLHDPFALPDMEPAVRRIRRAVQDGEHVAVYGDYDVDGMTSSCLMADYLRREGLTCEIYIPGRFDEGYGMNTGAIDALHQQGVTLIVTVDCGITDCDEVAYAASLGIDVIITDHHECKQTLPEALAIVNPKRPESAYPNPALAGVGVAFTAKYSRKPGFQENALRRRLAFSRIPFSSYIWKGVGCVLTISSICSFVIKGVFI